MTTFFETARLRARRFEPDDLAAFVAYRADPEVARYQSWSDYTAGDAAALIAQMQYLSPGVHGEWVQIALERRETGALVGDLAMRVDAEVPRTAEVGFTLSREHQGHGYGLEALRGLLGHAFTDLGLHRVFAATDPRNESSARLLTRVGMRQEAHHVESLFFKGAWADDLVFAILASEWARTATGRDPAATRPPQLIDTDLRGARFVRADLSGAVMRGVDVQDADIDAPWLLEDGGSLIVNGVDVAPLIEAELNRRFPGRDQRRTGDPEGLRRAWAALQRIWADTLERVESMPPGTVDVSVGGEWSFAQTLRHLVMATDTWLGRAVLEIGKPYHPVGQPNVEYATDGYDLSVFSVTDPSYAEVLEARADRVAMVRDFLEGVTEDELTDIRRHPWGPDHQETVLACLHVILNEEWEHLRYAVRDLDTIAVRTG